MLLEAQAADEASEVAIAFENSWSERFGFADMPDILKMAYAAQIPVAPKFTNQEN